MASKSSIEAGRGHVTLETRNLLQKGLDEAKASLQAWGKSIAAVGAAIAATGLLVTAPFFKGLEVFSEWGRETKNAMRMTGMSFEDLTLTMNGTRASADELVPAVAKMDQFIMNATQGSEEATRALAAMGMSLGDLQAASQGDRLQMFADGLNRISDAGERVARQREVFGKGGLSINLEGGSAGIRERARRAEEIGGARTPEMKAAADAYNGAMRDMSMATNGIWMSLGAAAAPVMTEIVQRITTVIIAVREWTEDNRPLLTTIFSIAEKAVLVGTAIAFLGGVIYASAYAFTILAGIASTAGMVLGVLNVFGWAYAAGAAAWSAITWLYTVAVGAANVSTWAYTAALVAAWIWENIASLGATLLITALGVLVLVVGAVVVAFGALLLLGGGLVALAAGVTALGIQFGEWHESLSFIDDAIADILETAEELWQAFADSSVGEFFASIADAASDLWDTITGAYDSVVEFLNTSGAMEFLAVIMKIALGIGIVAGVVVGLAGFLAYLAAEWVVTFEIGKLQAAVEWLSQLVDWGEVWGGVVETVGSLWGQFWDAWSSGIKQSTGFLSEFFGFFTNIADRAIKAGESIYDLFTSTASKIGDVMSDVASSTAAGFSKMFSGLTDTATSAWSGVMAAFKIGDWELLWAIVQAAAQLAWAQIVDFLSAGWVEWKNAGLEIFYAVKDFLVDTFSEAWTFIQTTGARVFDKIARGFLTLMIDAVRSMANALPTEGAAGAAAAPIRGALLDAAIGMSNARTNLPDVDRQERDLRSRAIGEWFDRQVAIVERETELAEALERERAGAGNADEIARLTEELGGLTWQAEGERAIQEYMAWINSGGGQPAGGSGEGSFIGGPKQSVAGSFSAAVIAGFIGADGGGGETRGEREQRMARELLQQVLDVWRNIERRPGWAMG